jgi:hypothetical protein
MAVHRDVGEIGEKPGRAIPPWREVEQLVMLVDEARGVFGRLEGGVGDQVLDEGEVGRDPADAKFAESTRCNAPTMPAAGRPQSLAVLRVLDGPQAGVTVIGRRIVHEPVPGVG